MAEVLNPSTIQTAHGKVWTQYDTLILADLEDSYWEHNAQDEGTLSTNLHFRLLQQALSLNPNPTVLEIGTGPGRVLLALSRLAAKQNLNLSSTHFIGLDNASAQLELAKRRTPEILSCGVGSIDWILADACAFASLPILREKQNQKVQFMPIFNFGSIFHLDKHDQTPRLFEQVAATLEPEKGIAVVSLQDHNITSRTITEEKRGVDYEGILEELENARWRSERFPDLVYGSVNGGLEKGDGFVIATHKTQVMRVGEDGVETLVEEHPVVMKQTCWDEGEFVQLMERYGLVVTETMKGVWETFYILKLSPRRA